MILVLFQVNYVIDDGEMPQNRLSTLLFATEMPTEYRIEIKRFHDFGDKMVGVAGAENPLFPTIIALRRNVSPYITCDRFWLLTLTTLLYLLLGVLFYFTRQRIVVVARKVLLLMSQQI